MPIMDGLAATKKLRALEAQEAKDSPEAFHSIRIPIVGLSADIQQSTKEVGKKKIERCFQIASSLLLIDSPFYVIFQKKKKK